jgi:16S rRNA (guanine1207-N2)-methyltransferase
MQLLSQFIERNAATVGTAKRLLWLNPPGDAPWRSLTGRGVDLHLVCQDRADFDRLQATGATAQFGDFPSADAPPPDAILLTLPREKPRLRMLAQWAASCLPPEGVLWIAGENHAGIKSCARQVEDLFAQVLKRDSARHCGLFEARSPTPGTRFDPDAWRETWSLQRPEGILAIHSWPGVFNHGALDAGTALLLDHLPDIGPGERILDFACGAGVIGTAALQRQPECLVTLCDANALALRATRATLAANDLQAEVIASDGLTEITGRYNLVLSNPPWHERHVEQKDLGMGLLEGIREHLAPAGRVVLVTNRHLPWPAWLERVFGAYQLLADAHGYRVLSAVEPRRRAAVR